MAPSALSGEGSSTSSPATSSTPSTPTGSLKVTDRIAALKDGEAYYTFEFFPPKTDQGLLNLHARMARMTALKPSCIHITWGAGGSTSERSLELAAVAQMRLGVPACLHLTCTNMEKETLERTLHKAKELGIVNLLALRGDPPRGEEYWIAADPQFQHGSDLVRYIRREYGDHFCIGVAGYPEGAPDSADRSQDVRYLKDKVDAGADFIVTQLFYDTDRFISWIEECRSAGITVPIIPGIMPIQNYASFRRLTNLCKAQVPADIVEALTPLQADDEAVKAYGVRLSARMIRRLLAAGIRGFHLCTLNLERSIKQIVDELDWAVDPDSPERHTRVNGSAAWSGTATPVPVADIGGAKALGRPNGSLGNSPTHATITIRPDGLVSSTKTGDAPTTWDEFPNGRFGDARSPAYGNVDGYGASLKVPPAEALRLWGRPTSEADISRLFSAYLRGTLPAIPWSEEELRLETSPLLPHLLALNERGWWTVGSQPSVDGVPSTDQAFGFGPPGGWIYQKAFVEFFASYEDLERLEAKVAESNRQDGVAFVRYFAGNRKKELRSNVGEEESNAVTWGVFRGKEVVTTTLIERMSFEAWRDEAFEIWDEWGLLYPKSSDARKLVDRLASDRWLISIVHHDFKDETALWKFLLA